MRPIYSYSNQESYSQGRRLPPYHTALKTSSRLPLPASRATRFAAAPQPVAAPAAESTSTRRPHEGARSGRLGTARPVCGSPCPGPRGPEARRRTTTPGWLPLTSPHSWLSAARLLVAVLVAAMLAALEQALRYSSIAGPDPSAPLRPPLAPSLAPLSPSSSLRCDWTRNGQYPASARPHPRGVPDSELGGRRQVVPSRGLVPDAWACSARDLGKSVLGAWSMRAAVEIPFLSEASTPQSYQTQLQTLKALREGSWLISPGLRGAMVWPG